MKESSPVAPDIEVDETENSIALLKYCKDRIVVIT